MKWFWGLLIIGLGLIFLGNNFGWWNSVAFESLWRFWPVILILLGITLVFRSWRFGWIIILIAFLASALLIAGNLFVNNQISDNTNETSQSSTFAEEINSDTQEAEITIQAGAGNINISGGSEKLLEGKISDANKFQANIDSHVENKKVTAKLTIKQISESFIPLRKLLNIKINDKIPTYLFIDSGASNLDFDFSNINLLGTRISTGASKLNLKIGDSVHNDANIDIKAGASNINIQIPSGIGTKISLKSGATSKNFKSFNKQDDNTYKTKNYDSAEKKINLNFETGASSLLVEQY
jgi:hypothetical protein